MDLRWQDVTNLVIGIWIGVSPWVFGYSELSGAMWNALAVGLVIVVLSLVDIDSPARWEEWSLAVLGVWLAASPWVLGYATQLAPMLNTVIAGAAVALLAAWALVGSGGFHHGNGLPSH